MLAQAGVSGAKWLSSKYGKKKPSMKDSPYGKELSRQANEGMYSPKAKAIMTNKAGQTFGATADDSVSDYKGQLISKGMGSSIAGAKGIKDIKLKQAEAVQKVASKVELDNETSKVSAKKELSMGQYQDKLANWEASNSRNQELVSGVGGAIAGKVGSMPGADGSSLNPEGVFTLDHISPMTGKPMMMYLNNDGDYVEYGV
jgi:hypothetical protein